MEKKKDEETKKIPRKIIRRAEGGETPADRPNRASDTRPRINADNKDSPEIAGRVWDVIKEHNDPPLLYNRGGNIVRVDVDERFGPFITAFKRHHLRHYLSRIIRFHTTDREGNVSTALPPDFLINDMLVEPEKPLPSLSGIVAHPLFAADGTLHFEPGYQAETKCYCHYDPSLSIFSIPQDPTANIVKEAVRIIEELICDFPFSGEAERAHAYALFLLPFVREMIDGPTPLHLIEAPTPGSGKSHLARALAYPAVGYTLPSMTEGGEEAEYRKRITAALENGQEFIFIDNVNSQIKSGALSSALTGVIWEDQKCDACGLQRETIPGSRRRSPAARFASGSYQKPSSRG